MIDLKNPLRRVFLRSLKTLWAKPGLSHSMHNQTMTMKRLIHPLIALCAAFGVSAFAHDAPQMDLQRTKLAAGMHQITAQVASTPGQRTIGLMFRNEMPQPEGMLFVFEQPGMQCFWMKNTLIPLTAAFVADDGEIVNLADMKPQSEAPHCSIKPVRYVLEMNLGWFAKKGIKAGAKLTGEAFTR